MRGHGQKRVFVAGFTVMEMLVVLAILGVVFTIVTRIFFSAFESVREVRARIQLQQEVRLALDRILRDLREVRSCQVSSAGTQVALARPSGTTVQYEYDPDRRLVTRKATGERDSILNSQFDVSSLRFEERSHLLGVTLSAAMDIPGTRRTTLMTVSSAVMLED